VSKFTEADDLRSFGILLDSANDYITVNHGHTSGTLVEQKTYATALVDDSIYYIAYSYNGSTQAYLLRVWDVGADEEHGSAASGTFTEDISLTAAPWRVGSRDGADYFDGLIDEVVIISGEAWDSTAMGQFFAGTYGGEATDVTFIGVAMITDPDGTPSIIENPTISISDSTRRYIGLEINRPVVVTLNPEDARVAIETDDSRIEYANFYSYQVISSRYFVIMAFDPLANRGDRALDIGFESVNAFDCRDATFMDSDDNDLCDLKTLTRTDLGGTGSVDIMVPGVIYTSDPENELFVEGDTVVIDDAFTGNWTPTVNVSRIIWKAAQTGNFDGSEVAGVDLYNLRMVSGTKTVGDDNRRRAFGMPNW
jgi:hypothetical protein